MRQVIKAVLVGIALYAGFVGVVVFGPTHGFLVGPGMVNAQRHGGTLMVGQTYTWTDSATGQSYTGTIKAIGPNYMIPTGYAPCQPESLRCLDDSHGPTCEVGAQLSYCGPDDARIDIFTPPAEARRRHWNAHNAILPPTIVDTPGGRAILSVSQSKAWAVFGGIGGGPNGPAEGTSKIVGITELGYDNYIIDYEVSFPDGSFGYYSVFYVGQGVI